MLLDQPFGGSADEVTRLVLCSGKVYVDLAGTGDEQRAERLSIDGVERIAVGRVEELYPFPSELITEALERLPNVAEVVWVQEEPQNMGAWTFVEPRLHEILGELPLRYVGRSRRASPAEGYATRHAEEQMRIVRESLSGAAPAVQGVTADLIGKRKL